MLAAALLVNPLFEYLQALHRGGDGGTERALVQWFDRHSDFVLRATANPPLWGWMRRTCSCSASLHGSQAVSATARTPHSRLLGAEAGCGTKSGLTGCATAPRAD